MGALAFLLVALLKPVFPENVGIWVRDDRYEIPLRIGANFPKPLNEHIIGGYWVIPICIALGLGLFVVTHRGARAFLASWRRRQGSQG